MDTLYTKEDIVAIVSAIVWKNHKDAERCLSTSGFTDGWNGALARMLKELSIFVGKEGE